MVDEEELIKCEERCILTVYATKTRDGQDAYRYDLPDREKLFKLIGFIESIKLDLLDYANEELRGEE